MILFCHAGIREEGLMREGDSRTVVNETLQAWREREDSMVGGELSEVGTVVSQLILWKSSGKMGISIYFWR
jgi:hypothetical protein